MSDDEPSAHGCLAHIRANLFGTIPVHELTLPILLAATRSILGCNRSHVVHFLAADPLVLAAKTPELTHVLQAADLNVADGLPLVWAIRAAGGATDRITATDGMLALCRDGEHTGVRHFFYGTTDATLQRLANNLRAVAPRLQIAGTSSPPFRPLRDGEVEAAAMEIKAAGTDILWLGLGAPKQNYLAEQFRALNVAPLIITAGAAFDFVGGSKRRAPVWMRQLGLEWLFRLAQEPRRLGPRYLQNNPRFVHLAARTVIASRRRPLVDRGYNAA